jgi:adhesin/invasin
MGAVDPPVTAGVAASAVELSKVTAGVTATVGGQPATVLFAGLAPGYAGLYQVNLVVPQLAPGDYPLQISAGGVASNTATISVR